MPLPHSTVSTMKRTFLIILAGLTFCAMLETPVFAQGGSQQFAFGGGYWTMGGADDQDGTIDTSGFYASGSMVSKEYYLEFDWSFEDPSFYALAADYIYPFDQSAGMFGGSTFLGAGYTYFSSDVFETEKGFNVLGGVYLGETLIGTVRYDFLGSDQELLTFGVTYMF